MRCAIVGSGNIGTDLMVKLLRAPGLELGAVIGIDPESDGLARARAAGLETSHEGADWLLAHADDFDVVFEATSAWVLRRNARRYEDAGLRVDRPHAGQARAARRARRSTGTTTSTPATSTSSRAVARRRCRWSRR